MLPMKNISWSNAGIFIEYEARIFLLTWSLKYIYDCLDMSWSRTVVSYGTLLSISILGECIGNVIGGSVLHQLSYFVVRQWCFLSLIILIFSISSRYELFSILFLFFGIALGNLRSSITCTKVSSSQAKLSYLGAIEDVDLKIAAGVLSCVPVICGILYSHTYSSSIHLFPAFTLVMVHIFFFLSVVMLTTLPSMHTWPSKLNKWLRKLVYKTESIDTAQEEGSTNVVKKKLPPVVFDGRPPLSFVTLCNGDEKAAKERYTQTLQWRQDNDMDNYVTRPQNHFIEILENSYPHFLHGYSRDGCLVFYEVIGRSKPHEFRKHGITPKDLVNHMLLRNELMFSRFLAPDRPIGSTAEEEDEEKNPLLPPGSHRGRPMGQIMSVLDANNIKMGDFTADTISFIQQSAEVIDNHFPGRAARLVICNVPYWFSSIWGVVARVLPPSIRSKICIMSGVDGLAEFIAPEERTPLYGGTGTIEMGQSKEHLAFANLPNEWKLQSNASDYSSEVPVNDSNNSSSSTSVTTAANSDNWFSNVFAAKSKAAPKKAFLGEDNSYYYDKESESWKLVASAVEEEIEETNQSEDQNDLEEHGLILAIQAAHWASQGTNQPPTQPRSPKQKPSDSVSQRNHHKTTAAERDAVAMNNVIDTEVKTNLEIESLSSQVFLLVTLLHMSSGFILYGLVTVLPAWMMSSSVQGGLSYSLLDFGLVLSTSAVLLYLFIIYLLPRLRILLSISPVISLRVSTGLLVIVLVLMPLLFLLSSYQVHTHTFMEDDISFAEREGGEYHLHTDNSLNAERQSAGLLFVFQSLCALLFNLPSIHPIALISPAWCIAILVLACYLNRKSTLVLMQVALKKSFQSPLIIVSTIGAISDILTPVIASVAFGYFCHSGHHHDDHSLHSPSKSYLILPFFASLAALMYGCSLLITIQFRGDFGLLAMDSTSSSTSDAPMNNRRAASVTECIRSLLADALHIPWSDCKLLFSLPPVAEDSGGHIINGVLLSTVLSSDASTSLDRVSGSGKSV